MLKPPLQKDQIKLALLLIVKILHLQVQMRTEKRQASRVRLIVQVGLCLTDGVNLMKTYSFFTAPEW